jgi:hypothetical protein
MDQKDLYIRYRGIFFVYQALLAPRQLKTDNFWFFPYLPGRQ